MQPSLKALRTHQVEGPDDLMHPGDFYIRNVPMYNSSKIINAIIIKCPYCGIDMMSTEGHRIKLASKFRKLLSFIGISAGISVFPKLVCPYNRAHSFMIEKGKIYKTI